MRDCALLNSALQDDLENPAGILTSDMSVESANRLWLAGSFWKKFQDSVGPEADEACLSLFKSSNERCRLFSLSPLTTYDNMVINEAKSLFDSMFHAGPDLLFDLSVLFEGLTVGPGASIDVSSYNFYTKLFDSTLTSTSSHLYRYYRDAIRSQPSWFCAEEARSTHHGARIVAGNRLSFVPKTSEISRSICTEPNLNMLFQKGIGSFLEKQLKRRFRIDLSYQPELNRRLAQIGSKDGTFGTIDLSSASDSMSLNLMRACLPEYFFRWLVRVRSPAVIFPDGSSSELHMISSMGNAFTFPLQTMLFAILVVSCYRVLGIKPLYGTDGPENFAVFGDDIIVRKDAYHFVAHCLELFGFTVNDAKSFNSGDFRESCGSDFYKGFDIRGVYIKSLLTSADVYSAINRLVRWSTRTGIMLPRTVSVLLDWAGPKALYIPFKDGDAEGIKVPNPPDDVKWVPDIQCFSYKALVKQSSSFRVPNEGIRTYYYPRLKGKRIPILFNPDGLVVSFVAGFIRNERVSIRSTGPDRFKVRRRVTSSWGGVVIPRSEAYFVQRLTLLDQGSLSPTEVRFADDTASAGNLSRGDEWKIVAADYFTLK
jgi:hypothetical protein